MKNTMINKISAVVILALLAGLLTYFYISLNRMDKKLVNIQTVVVESSGTVSEIVNFFNANINATPNN